MMFGLRYELRVPIFTSPVSDKLWLPLLGFSWNFGPRVWAADLLRNQPFIIQHMKWLKHCSLYAYTDMSHEFVSQ